MSPYREPVVVETGRIVWQEWICESKAKGSCADGMPSSGCRVLTLQGYDIEESVSESSDMIGGGYFQFGSIRFYVYLAVHVSTGWSGEEGWHHEYNRP